LTEKWDGRVAQGILLAWAQSWAPKDVLEGQRRGKKDGMRVEVDSLPFDVSL